LHIRVGLFKPEDFRDPAFSDELESDIASECEKCGVLEKLTLFSSNPRGVAVVKFSTSFAAQECIRLMNGRFFGGSKLKAYFWDGVTNYSVTVASAAHEEEEEKAEAHRLDEFGDWLENEQEDLPEEFRLRTE
jgi:HIV Tat-specific factor 1